MFAPRFEQVSHTGNNEKERFVLPPISALEEYIPKRQQKQQQQQQQNNTNNKTTNVMLSPPNSFTPSTSSSCSFSSPVLIHHPPSPPRAAFEKMDSPLYPYQDMTTSSSPTSTSSLANSNAVSSNNNGTMRTVSSDVDQVVQHAHNLYENMVHYKPYLLSSNTTQQHYDELRPWMDDMIAKANQVLNALLRLRKQQMVASLPTSTGMVTDHHHYDDHQRQRQHSFSQQHSSYQSSFSSISSSSLVSPSSSPSTAVASSLPTASSSSLITITKRDWPYSTHQTKNVNATSIPSRHRKRGKRATFQGRCHSCNISETPEWRRGPDGARTLCNACGLHYAKLARKKAAATVQTENSPSLSSCSSSPSSSSPPPPSSLSLSISSSPPSPSTKSTLTSINKTESSSL